MWGLSPGNEKWPDLVKKYTAFLQAQWKAHQALAQRFTPGGEVALTPEQLETLRSLGYIGEDRWHAHDGFRPSRPARRMPEPPGSATLHQRRWHTESLDAVEDRCQQLAHHRHFGHPERHVLGVPNHFGPIFMSLSRSVVSDQCLTPAGSASLHRKLPRL